MGKASSSKKIARAARAGGRASGVRQRNLLFPGAVGAVVILGSALVIAARADHVDNASDVAPRIDDHWHAAFGISVCGEFQPDVGEFESPVGIHTHGDGVIHIHPFSSGGAGENATMGVFLDGANIELTDDELTIGDETWENHESECDGETGELVVARWQNVQTTDEEPSLTYSGFDDLRFRNDGEGYTIAFVPEDETDIPQPSSATNLADLGAVDAEDPSGATSTTVAGDGSTTTTAPGDGTTTTAPGGTTTTTAAP